MNESSAPHDWRDEPARPDLKGHKAIREGICYGCGGPLFGPGGRFNESLVELSTTSAFAAAICQQCKEEEKANDQLQSPDLRERQRAARRTKSRAH